MKQQIPIRTFADWDDNAHLKAFCEGHRITFPRSRPYCKNDSCHVEQKNYSVVRKVVGYYRYDTEAELTILRELYRELRLYTNYFQPVTRVVRRYGRVGRCGGGTICRRRHTGGCWNRGK